MLNFVANQCVQAYECYTHTQKAKPIKPTLMGILCDVSGSMRKNAQGQFDKKDGTWARSVFDVMDDLIRNDVSPNNRVFTIGIGASTRDDTFDVLATIEQFIGFKNTELNHSEIVENIFDILYTKGARNIRKWAQTDIVMQSVSYDLASLFLYIIRSNEIFLSIFVNECLPPSCRDWKDRNGNQGYIRRLLHAIYSSGVTFFVQASEGDIRDVVKKALNKLLKKAGSVFTFQNASQIIHGCVGQRNLTFDRVNDLMKIIEPFVYGDTPLYGSLRQASRLFKRTEYKSYKKILFILSDGEPTDDGNTDEIVRLFSNAGIIIVSCFVNSTSNIESIRLYCEFDRRWSSSALLLFNLSSQISTERLPRTIFVKRGWKIDISNNQTKLFMQVNDPENIRDACKLAKNVVCSQEALSEILVSVSLDMYINQNNSTLKATLQDEESCYANASATVVHLSMKRILGRKQGYPDFQKLRQEIIKRHGKQRTNTLSVLRVICPIYRLKCKEIGIGEALIAISEKRPVVATFGLTKTEWSTFCSFYDTRPKGILTKTSLDISNRSFFDKLLGHAVVLTSYNSECLYFMNSWGDEWADMGFFRVQNSEVLKMKFIDVFWTSNDLLYSEKAYYKTHGGTVANELIKVLSGLQVAKYECPLCQCDSLVRKFKGTLVEAVCPKCKGKFRCNASGNILIMNIYLTSLATD